MIILVHKPWHSGFSACRRLERRVEGSLKTAGLRIKEIGSNFGKMALNSNAPKPPQLTLPRFSFTNPPDCSVFSSTGKQPNKKRNRRNTKCSGPLQAHTYIHTLYEHTSPNAVRSEITSGTGSWVFCVLRCISLGFWMRWTSWKACKLFCLNVIYLSMWS